MEAEMMEGQTPAAAGPRKGDRPPGLGSRKGVDPAVLTPTTVFSSILGSRAGGSEPSGCPAGGAPGLLHSTWLLPFPEGDGPVGSLLRAWPLLFFLGFWELTFPFCFFF